MLPAANPQDSSDQLIEQPLPPLQNGLYFSQASLLIISFYLYCLLILSVDVMLLVAPFVGSILQDNWGIFILCFPALLLHARNTLVFLNGLRISRSADYFILLPREEAPGLWALVEDMAQRIKVEVPHEIVLTNGVNAGVRLLGRRTGKGRSQLALGFDLLAGLSPAQVRAVVAHELAHAKYVRRGYTRFIFAGLKRAARLATALQYLNDHDDVFTVASTLAWELQTFPQKIRRATYKLLARCSRHDEFVADQVSAEICGSHHGREALFMTCVLESQLQKISWRDRIVHLKHQKGYTAWLREALQVPSDEKRLEITARTLELEQRHEYNTHPVLADRVAALDALAAAGDNWLADGVEAGTDWLHDPDQNAAKLLQEIERSASEEERSKTRELEREKKHLFRLVRIDLFTVCQYIVWNMITFIVFVVGLLLLASMGVAVKYTNYYHVLAYVMGVAIIFFYWKRDNIAIEPELPVPTLATYRSALQARRKRARAEREKWAANKELAPEEKRLFEAEMLHEDQEKRIELGRQLRPLLPTETKNPKMVAHFWAQKAVSFLEKGEYDQAQHCARLVFEAKQRHLAGLLIYGVCGAFEQSSQEADAVHLAWSRSRVTNVRWAVAWGYCLLGKVSDAEPYLIQLTRGKPYATYWALLGECQAKNGKPHEALFSRRRALELGMSMEDLENEACHRHDLTKSLLSLGQLEEALVQFEWLEARLENGPLLGIDDFELGIDWLRWQVVSENVDRALEIAANLTSKHSEAKSLAAVGEVLSESSVRALKQTGRSYFERILDMNFYPDVKLSLAQIAFDNDQFGEARRLVLEALDAGKPRPFDALSSLSILKPALDSLANIDNLMPRKVQAFEAHLDASDTPLRLKDLWLLCYFEDENQALAAATEIFEALLPEYELEEWITVELAGPEFQPQGTHSPQILTFRFVAE